MAYEFKIKQSPLSQRWYWTLIADNGEPVADGSEGYADEGNVKEAIERIRHDFMRQVVDGGEYLVLRKEHWEAIKFRHDELAVEKAVVAAIEDAAL